MLTASKPVVALYVDRTTRQWIVRDSEGKFWSLPSTDNPWGGRHRSPRPKIRNCRLFRGITSTRPACRFGRK